MTGEDPAVVALVRGSSEQFAALAERHRRELRVHCYRMLGNLDEAEDLVQDTLARPWRRLDRPDRHDWSSVRPRANYVRMWGEQQYTAITIDVLRFDHGRLVGIATFGRDRFPAFGLPETLEPIAD